ncbi:MAG: porin family protein, partial [bacterium]|nr:porin family protein [bacterium]
EEKLITIKFSYQGSQSDDGKSETAVISKTFDITFILNQQVLGGVSSKIIVQPVGHKKYKGSLSFHAGYTFPTGNFNIIYDSSFMLGLNIDYHFTPQLSLLGFLGYNRFKAASTLWDDTHLWNLSANLKYEFTTNRLRPFVNAGGGIYIPKSGNAKPGINMGIGLDYSLNTRWIAEWAVDYHYVFTSGSSTRFFVTHAGLIYRF